MVLAQGLAFWFITIDAPIITVVSSWFDRLNIRPLWRKIIDCRSYWKMKEIWYLKNNWVGIDNEILWIMNQRLPTVCNLYHCIAISYQIKTLRLFTHFFVTLPTRSLSKALFFPKELWTCSSDHCTSSTAFRKSTLGPVSCSAKSHHPSERMKM